MSKSEKKMHFDIRARIAAEAKAEDLEARLAAAVAAQAALQAAPPPTPPAPAAPAAPAADPREARRAEIRAAADAMSPLDQRAFLLRNHFALLPLADQDVVLAQRGIVPKAVA
jgi:hypothetical protein